MFTKRCAFMVRSWWRLTRVYFQILRGMLRMSRLPQPIISIFGGSRFKENDPYFKHAYELAHKFVMANVSVVTGGGPGIMQAANCGVSSYPGKTHAKSIGIGVRELGEGKNPCVQEYFELDYFFARKWLLTRYSVGFIVFPGGFGTLDELFEILTLMQTKKMGKVPIVLVGVEYWTPLITWLNKEGLTHHSVITADEMKLITVTDDLEEAFRRIRDESSVIDHKMR